MENWRLNFEFDSQGNYFHHKSIYFTRSLNMEMNMVQKIKNSQNQAAFCAKIHLNSKVLPRC